MVIRFAIYGRGRDANFDPISVDTRYLITGGTRLHVDIEHQGSLGPNQRAFPN